MYTHTETHIYIFLYMPQVGLGVNKVQGPKSEMLQSLNKPQTLILVVTVTVSTESAMVNLSLAVCTFTRTLACLFSSSLILVSLPKHKATVYLP